MSAVNGDIGRRLGRIQAMPYHCAFGPAFFFVAITAPLLPRLRAPAMAGHILDGINVAPLALMVVVSWQLARSAFQPVHACALRGSSLVSAQRAAGNFHSAD